MPAKSKKQLRFIYAMRNKYKKKKYAPKNMKWVFNKEWTEGVKMKDLPEYVKKNESFKFIMNYDKYLKNACI